MTTSALDNSFNLLLLGIDLLLTKSQSIKELHLTYSHGESYSSSSSFLRELTFDHHAHNNQTYDNQTSELFHSFYSEVSSFIGNDYRGAFTLKATTFDQQELFTLKWDVVNPATQIGSDTCIVPSTILGASVSPGWTLSIYQLLSSYSVDDADANDIDCHPIPEIVQKVTSRLSTYVKALRSQSQEILSQMRKHTPYDGCSTLRVMVTKNSGEKVLYAHQDYGSLKEYKHLRVYSYNTLNPRGQQEQTTSQADAVNCLISEVVQVQASDAFTYLYEQEDRVKQTMIAVYLMYKSRILKDTTDDAMSWVVDSNGYINIRM